MSERLTYMPVEAQGITQEMEQELSERKGYKGKRDWEHFTPDFVDTQLATINPAELIAQSVLVRGNYEKSRLAQNEGRVKFSQDLPVSIAFMGDMHIGSNFSNIEEVKRKFDEIRDTPNMYTVLMSNLIDNAIPSQFPSNMLVNNLTPDRQVLLMRSWVQELNAKGKILGAVTSPCHEGWTWKHTGQDINALIYGFEGRKFPVLENGGRLTLEFPQVTYRGNLYHQVGPFESNFNKTHALKQLNRLNLLMTADFIAGAHRHVNSAEVSWEGMGELRKTVAYIRTGSEKGTDQLHDSYAVDRLGKTGEPTGPVLTLFGDKRMMIANPDFDTGVLCHESVYVAELYKREKDINEQTRTTKKKM